MDIQTAIKKAHLRLKKKNIKTSVLDSEILMSNIIKKDRKYIILNFNNEYKGGQLYFWHDYELQLGKGDIIMFPSLFMYPHGVKEPTEGERFSGVCWAW